MTSPAHPRPSRFQRLLLSRDYRPDLPPSISRFIGYRSSPPSTPPFQPLPFPPFTWLTHLPLHYEACLFGWLGSLGAIFLIESLMSGPDSAFRVVYSSPLVITSFGASAVLLFGVVESPLSQPRNFVLGHFFSALIATTITRLWALNPDYEVDLEHNGGDVFMGNTFSNGGLCLATSLTFMVLTGTVHPPAGATALDAALHADIVHLSWRFLPVVVVSSLIMLIWALIINNLGRRRYPLYWWSPDRCFVRPSIENDVQGASEDKASEPDGRIDRAEDGRTRKISGLGERQRIEGKEDQGEERETGDEQRLGSDVMTELGKRV